MEITYVRNVFPAPATQATSSQHASLRSGKSCCTYGVHEPKATENAAASQPTLETLGPSKANLLFVFVFGGEYRGVYRIH